MFFLSAEDCNALGDNSTQSGATLEILRVDAPGSSPFRLDTWEERCVHGQGEGKLVVERHETLFTASEHSLSADHSVAKSLDCGEQLDCLKELAVQFKIPLLIHHAEVRLTLLKFQQTTRESKHLYDSIC